MKSILPSAWTLPQRIRDRLGESAGRQRAMEAEGHLLLVLHQPPTAAEPERAGRFFWRDPAGAWKSNACGAGIQGLKSHIDEYATKIDKLEDALQVATSSAALYAILRELAPLARTTRNMLVALQQARELCPADRDLIVLRDRAGELDRAAELALHDAQASLDYQVAYHQELESQRTYEMAVATHRLNLLVALFFPIATLSSILGMNVVHGLENARSPQTFYMVLGAGLAAGLILAIGVGRRPAPASHSQRKPAPPK